MLDEQSSRNFPDGRFRAVRQAVHQKQQLVLLRFNPVLFGGCFAEVKKLPYPPPEFGQVAILIAGQIALRIHDYIVSRYI
jgi:hypothetical protein